MRNIFSVFVFVMIGCIGSAQETQLAQDQNPNYKKAMNRFLKNSQEYTIQQGTTVQETYKAIDPLEEKRELRSLRRQYRSQRAYWRHERRLKRIENTRYYDYGSYYSYRPRGYDWLTLGILGACILW
ncbi:hypothetical protein IWQ47_001890 [Aquimarina sp. EL_43]|uniref:hypothetical protein n=1 Tax=unclassified Aquimarina TaxID=2627091 RepID=UPI0018CBC8B1|nr:MULTISPECIES: hypothetical protein [unclassified Aquimarina]MBG6130027.1 hypothetical protein [Aquimarina sp. EL_35]MBG6148807.1 hypothetical protein [Aquimarina sp. EL_32]MBG6168819.1 hypothetical protein [Aquimarina sp. EL_43]